MNIMEDGPGMGTAPVYIYIYIYINVLVSQQSVCNMDFVGLLGSCLVGWLVS